VLVNKNSSLYVDGGGMLTKCCHESTLSSLWGMKDRRKLGKEIRK
jgi:hypothetical protein